jgi:hypothetical protein
VAWMWFNKNKIISFISKTIGCFINVQTVGAT